VAHLYNGVRQLHLLNEKSPIMERIIQMHTKAIFADAIRTKTKDLAARLWSCIDYKSFWRDYGDERWYLKPHPASSIMELTLSDDRDDRANGYSQLEKHIAKSADASRKRHHRTRADTHDMQEALKIMSMRRPSTTSG